MYWVYVLRCDQDSYYIGMTKNLKRRLEQHDVGKGAQFTKYHKPKELAYKEACHTRSDALAREYQLVHEYRRKYPKMTVIGSVYCYPPSARHQHPPVHIIRQDLYTTQPLPEYIYDPSQVRVFQSSESVSSTPSGESSAPCLWGASSPCSSSS